MTTLKYQCFRKDGILKQVCVRNSNATPNNSISATVFYVSLEDIHNVFPDAIQFQLDGQVIPFLTESNGTRILPPRIAYHDEKVLDVISSAPSSGDQPSLDNVLSSELTSVYSLDSSFASRNSVESTSSDQTLNGKQIYGLSLDSRVRVRSNEVAGGGFQLEPNEKDETGNIMIKNQVVDTHAFQQNQLHSILAQNFELHENPIPRLFIILPVDKFNWDSTDITMNKFRLYFLCECCCDFATVTDPSKGIIENEIHMTSHEGYDIKNSKEFFSKYAKYMLTLMRGLRLGLHLDGTKISHSQTQGLLEAGIDYSIGFIEALTVDNPRLKDMHTIDDDHALGSGDLRQLGTFLRVKNGDKMYGDLYRIKNKTGRVRWVCINHLHHFPDFNESEQHLFSNAIKSYRDSFDLNLGKVTVEPQSRIKARELFKDLSEFVRLYDLDIRFDWDCTKADIEAFGHALKKSNVSILRLQLQRVQTSIINKLLSPFTRYGTLGDIIDNPNMAAIQIFLSTDFVQYSCLQPKTSQHLRKLSVELVTLIEPWDFRVLVRSLKAGSILTELDLGMNLIGNTRISVLSKALKFNMSLTRLSLKAFADKIGAEEMLALSEMLKSNTTLTYLCLAFNRIEYDGVLALSEGLRANSALTSLNLNSSKVGDSGMFALSAALKVNTTLANLYLSQNLIGPEGAQALSDALKINTALTKLDLRYNNIGDEGTLALSEAFKISTALIDLTLVSNSIGGKGILALSDAFKSFTTLTTLQLSNNHIGDEGAIAISEALCSNINIYTLYLGDNSIGNEGAMALSRMLKINTSLTIFYVNNNLIEKEGSVALLEALMFNTTLHTFNLGKNSITSDGAIALSEALKINTTLSTLNLSTTQLGDEGVIVLSEALKINTTLTSLSLEENSIGKKGTLALSEALKINKGLEVLYLRRNSIADDGAIVLSDMLNTNTTLSVLCLESNSIKSEGAIALSKALKINSTLTILHLWDNSIGDEGAVALADALKINANLIAMSMHYNKIGKEGILALSEMLKINTTLLRFDCEPPCIRY
ncbi:hypothetical protein BGZ76_010047 [Entomortierella beljakovae]|nr:hypothetical protein BGZ76_010047 [Entomortierella beljakovae]